MKVSNVSDVYQDDPYPIVPVTGSNKELHQRDGTEYLEMHSENRLPLSFELESERYLQKPPLGIKSMMLWIQQFSCGLSFFF